MSIPTRNLKNLSIRFIPAVGKEMSYFSVEMKPDSTVGQLKQLLAKEMESDRKDPRQLLMVEVHNYKIVRTFFDDQERISTIHPKDALYVYELASSSTQMPSIEMVCLEVKQRARISNRSGTGPFQETTEDVCFPFIVLIPRNVSYDQLKQILEERVKSFIQIAPGKDQNLLKDFNIHLLKTNGADELLSNRGTNQKINLNEEDKLAIEWGRVGISKNAYLLTRNVFKDITGEGVSNKPLTLDECLQEYVTQEKLSKDDQWYQPS